MADDIVERLRQQAIDETAEVGIYTDRVEWEAADEIERLRAVLGRAATLLSSYGDGSVIYPDEQAVIDEVTEEARRG